jgi:hypothetical protein
MDLKRTARKHERDLLAKANVVAVGVGYKNGDGPLSVMVSVTRKVPAHALAERDLVPDRVNGALTDVVEVGEIKALAAPAPFSTKRERPALGGDSIGHHAITAGTLGCVLRRGGDRVILSNNHVMANSNEAEVGDPILQPGAHDGGTLDDAIASLEAFVPITFGGGLPIPSECPIANAAAWLLRRRTRLMPVVQAEDNLVDAAVALPYFDEDVSDEIRGIGALAGIGSAELGMAVQKRGRTTDHTTGTIEQVGVTVNVQYGEGKVATFRDQVMAGPMSEPGDSGSAVLDMGRNLVGLLFAGSEQVTICNRIEHVVEALDLSL